MAFSELISRRQPKSVTFYDSVQNQYRLVSSLAPLHYDPGNGNLVRLDMTPIRITPGVWGRYPNFDGWLVTENGWLYGLGVDGWVYFGGRRGQHYVRFRLRELGYVRANTGAFTAISGLPDYNTANLSSVPTQAVIEGETYTVGTTAEWHNLLTAGGGELFLRFKARGDGLKSEYVITQAAREWIVANRPPSFYGIPAPQAYLAFRFDIDWSDIPRKIINGVLQGDTFDDVAGGVELRNTLDELLAFMPIGEAYAGEGLLERQSVALRKRFTSGLMTMGAPVSALNALPAGDLTFDPTITPSVGASGDDGSWITGVGFGATDTSQVIGRYASTYDVNDFWRFTGVTVPKDAAVSSAYLTLVAFSTNSGTSPTVTLYAVAADNQAAPTDATTAGAMAEYGSGHSWSPPAFTAGSSYNTVDFATSAQGVFARAGWASGNAFVVEILSTIGSGSNSRSVAAWDHATYPAPQFTVIYTIAPEIVTLGTETLAYSTLDPTVVRESLSLTLSTETETLTTLTLGVVLDSLALSLGTESVLWETVDPTIPAGAVVVTLDIETLSLVTIDPSSVLASLDLDLGLGLLEFTSIDPSSVLGSLVLTSGISGLVWGSVDPTTVLSSIQENLGQSQILWSDESINPVVGSITFSLDICTLDLSVIDPIVDTGGLVVVLGTGVLEFLTVDGTVFLGSLVVSLDQVSILWSDDSIEVVRASLILTLAEESILWSEEAITTILKSLTTSLSPESILWTSLGLTVAADGLVVELDTASIVFETQDLTSLLGTLVLPLSSADLAELSIDPQVILESIVLSPEELTILWAGVDPVISLGSTILNLGIDLVEYTTINPGVLYSGSTQILGTATLIFETSGPLTGGDSLVLDLETVDLQYQLIDPIVVRGRIVVDLEPNVLYTLVRIRVLPNLSRPDMVFQTLRLDTEFDVDAEDTYFRPVSTQYVWDVSQMTWTVQKTPYGIEVYELDWSSWLRGETIVSATWAVESGNVVIDSSVTLTEQARVQLSGGTEGTRSSIVNRVTTSSGRQDERHLEILIVKK